MMPHADAGKKGYRLIIFDWDGTVLDSLPKMIDCYRLALEIMELPAPAPDLLRQVAGRGWHLAMPALLPDRDDILYQDLATIYHQLWRRGGLPEPELIAGTAALLQDLRDRGYLLAVATSRSRSGIERESQGWGLRHFFHAVRGFDDNGPKPQPGMLHSILEELAVAPNQALMVGDTDTDIQMAHNAGVDSCGVISGGLSRQEFDKLGATLVLADISGLSAILHERAPAGAGNDVANAAKAAGGEAPAVRVTDRHGAVWLVKTVADPARRLLEHVIFNGYRVLGVAASECRQALDLETGEHAGSTGDQLFIRAAPFLDFQKYLGDAGADDHAEIRQKASRGFVADCLFANSVVFSAPLSAFTFDAHGDLCRTRVATRLDLAAAEDSDLIDMIDAARNADLWPKAAFFFSDIRKRDLIAQIEVIEARRHLLVPDGDPRQRDLANGIRALLNRRIDLLLAYRDRLLAERSAYLAGTGLLLRDPGAVVTFDKEFDNASLAVNGIAFAAASAAQTDPAAIDEPPFILESGHRAAAGIVVVEADNRVWIYEPLNHHGSHQHAFPKGQVDGDSCDSADLQRTAVRETWEEVGIQARITGHLADLSFYSHQTRYYLGERIGGDPCQAHWEAAKVRLVPMADLHRFLNIENDRTLLRHLLDHFKLPLRPPPITSFAGTSRAHLWRGIQGGLATADRETAGATRGRWFEDETGAHWFMKRDLFIQGLQTSAEVVAARIYDFFGYRVPETQKLVSGGTHLVFSKDVGPARDITDFTGLDQADVRRLRVVAAYLNDWARLANAMDNLVTADGTLTLIDFGATLGVRSRGRLKPGPPFGPAVGYFPATRDFWVFYEEYEVRREPAHPWQRLTAADLPPLIARFEQLDDAVIDDIVAAARYPSEEDAQQVTRALKWRRDAVVDEAAAYFYGQGERTGKHAISADDWSDLPQSGLPTLGRITELLVDDPTRLRYDRAAGGIVFPLDGANLPLGRLLRHLQRELEAATSADRIALSAETLKRHWRAFFTADLPARYLINVSGLYDSQQKGNATDLGVAGDAMSLRQYTSYLFYPMNALFRLELEGPESVLALRGMYQVAARNFFRLRGVHPRLPIGENMIRLYDVAASITGPDDAKLHRLLGEQILHNIMAARALLRQTPLDPKLHPRLYRIVDLDPQAFERYRKAQAAPPAAPGNLLAEYAFTSTSLAEARSDLHSRRDKKFKFIITPSPAGTRGRYLDGAVDNVVSASEQEVLFPPGTSFRVTRIEEAVSGDTTRQGEPRVHLYLAEAAPDNDANRRQGSTRSQ